MRKFVICLIMPCTIGCSARYDEAPLSMNHPANAEANTAPAASRSAVLNPDTAEPVKDPQSHQHVHEGTKDILGAKHEHAGMSAHAEDQGTKPPSTQATIYVCPMHPEVTSDEPGQRCPKCGMKLVPKPGGAP